MPGQHSLSDVLEYVSSRGRNFTFSFEDLTDLFLVNITYEHRHRSFVLFKKQLDALFPDVDIPNLLLQLAREDFESWDPGVFNSIISWLRAGHLDPLSRDDDVAKQQVYDYLKLHRHVTRMKLPTVHNHIVDVIKARTTCHEGWFDASLVGYVYYVTERGDGLRRLLVDSFVYKSYRQIKRNPTAKAYWSTQRSIVLSENIDDGNTAFVMDQADAAAEIIQNPYISSPCHYHNHEPGTKCYFAAQPSLKRKRQDSVDDLSWGLKW